jgi:hypothetical protein
LWDFKEVIQWVGKRGIEWTLVPMGGQHFNGQAERMTRLIKRQIWRSFEGRKYLHKETVTILKEAAQVVDSRPLSRNPWPEGEPLCPQDLMLGRARPGQPIVKFETGLPAARLTEQHKMQLLQEEQPRVKLLREEQPELGLLQREQHVLQRPQKEQPRTELLQEMQLPQGGAARGKAAPRGAAHGRVDSGGAAKDEAAPGEAIRGAAAPKGVAHGGVDSGGAAKDEAAPVEAV